MHLEPSVHIGSVSCKQCAFVRKSTGEPDRPGVPGSDIERELGDLLQQVHRIMASGRQSERIEVFLVCQDGKAGHPAFSEVFSSISPGGV